MSGEKYTKQESNIDKAGEGESERKKERARERVVRWIVVKYSMSSVGCLPIPSLSYRLNVNAHKTPPHAYIPTNTLLAKYARTGVV